MSDRGAFSDLLSTVLERIVLGRGGGREEFLQTLAGSVCASGDMAHATHPNYPERHEPAHHIDVNGGPVLKVNQNLRYATDAAGAGAFALACDQAGRAAAAVRAPRRPAVRLDDRPDHRVRTGLTHRRRRAPPSSAMHSARELMGAATSPCLLGGARRLPDTDGVREAGRGAPGRYRNEPPDRLTYGSSPPGLRRP